MFFLRILKWDLAIVAANILPKKKLNGNGDIIRKAVKILK